MNEKSEPNEATPSSLTRDLDIRRLLRRAPLHLDSRSVDAFLRDRVAVITGAAGSIGSEICRQVAAFRPGRLVLFDHCENGLFSLERELHGLVDAERVIPRVGSISDPGRVRTLFDQFRPEIIIHAAAHKHVPMMESNPGEAVKNNVLGTKIVADAAIQAGVEAFVLISTDKAVNPVSVMGACKRAAETYIQALSEESTATRFVTVRFGNVLGSNGSVVPLFEDQIRRGGPVTVTHPDITRFFMTLKEASQLVLQASAVGRSGDTLVFDMGEPVRILDLARDLIHQLSPCGDREVEVVFTGLRPGERLHESLFNEGEDRLSTAHPLISRVRRRAVHPDRLRLQFDAISRIVDGPDEDVIAALKELVPEYQPEIKITV